MLAPATAPWFGVVGAAPAEAVSGLILPRMDVVDLDARAAVSMMAILSGMAPEKYDATTPCAGWTVTDLLRHVVAGNVKFVAIAEGTQWARGAPAVDLGNDPVRRHRESLDVRREARRSPGD